MLPDYKQTLLLPKTNFPMKANLAEREKEILKFWEEKEIYKNALEGKSKIYTLHDGPPYANGPIHLGHALNKIIKDITVKYRILAGYKARFIPGWDCHGLPIEHEVEKMIGRDNPTKIRRECRKHAERFIEVQRKEFKKLGIFGEWDNPYITMSKEYEAKTLEALLILNEKGLIYRSLRPVFWCSNCRTALAEAEVEYRSKKSASIFVAFPQDDLSALIWTTTPWTIPGNFALCVNPEIEYVVIETEIGKFLVSKGSLKRLPISGKVIRELKGENLEGMKFKHPFYPRESPVTLGNFVSEEEGTGIVHIAPGHGEEDWLVGLKLSIPIISVVDEEGRMTKDTGFLKGLDHETASNEVVKTLREKGLLLGEGEFEHSYPHCWRCKKPIIFRATAQWFIKIDELREKVLEEIEKVKWYPEWAKTRMYLTLKSRPDWCISRQRNWGVPIPYVICKRCGEATLSNDVIRKTADAVRKIGVEAWWEMSLNSFLPEGFLCPNCGAKDFDKGKDILDVWIDSGISFWAVLGEDDLNKPADLYVEGTDQHRGWFQSSMIMGCALEGKAPYKAVLTHGFILDQFRRKMSKSLGNVISPEDIVSEYGAEIIRLWVVYEDPREDVKISEDILKEVVDIYRKIRNTIRFMLGNIEDFKDPLPDEKLLPQDAYILKKFYDLMDEVRAEYENARYHIVMRKIYLFCDKELSSFYLDIVKDRLYCEAKHSEKRISCQTVILRIVKGLIVALSPILSFTSEEAYKFVGEKESTFLESFPKGEIKREDMDKILKLFEFTLRMRSEVLKKIEVMRKEKIVGNSLEAAVSIKIPTFDFEEWKISPEDFFKEVFIVSKVSVEEGEGTPEIFKAPGNKCQRCWTYSEKVGENLKYPDLCPRCFKVMSSIPSSSSE